MASAEISAPPAHDLARHEPPPELPVPGAAKNGYAPPPRLLAVGALPPPVAAQGGARTVLAWLVVSMGGVALVGTACLLVAFCLSRGVGSNTAGHVEAVAGGNSHNGDPEMLVETARKATPVALIVLSSGEEQKVEEVLANGLAFLRQAQGPDGNWPPEHGYAVGPTALAALTLIECGMPVDDPCIKQATVFIRNACSNLTRTYEISLVLLFLNRLGDGADRERLQALALRLVAGQTPGGGWGYDCPILNPPDQDRLLALLEDLKMRSADDVRRAQGEASVASPHSANRLAVLHDQPNRPLNSYRQDGADNSNTQFAILALWAARAHGLPLDRTLHLLARRFQATQHADGSWDYRHGARSVNAQGNPTMTCAGLLGLAVGLGLAADTRKSGARPAENPGIQRALGLLARSIDSRPKGRMSQREPDMYFLWSIERVAVLYHLGMIGDRRWYHWGMDLMLPWQEQDGGWHAGGGHGSSRIINTCFAMLFLKRVNLAKDLTDKIAELVATQPPPGPARKQ
jgi:hypothetical protein